MTGKQRLLKISYPFFSFFTSVFKVKKGIFSSDINPEVSFYSLSATLNNGKVFHFKELQGKKVMIVNTASDCGYTAQYATLQKLISTFPSLVILGFPSNDFNEQEKGTDDTVARFCTINYGVTFPIFTKSVVLKQNGQSSVFEWLTDSSKNGWNNRPPIWNFCKYLVNEKGSLTHIFESGIEPDDKRIRKLL